MTDNPEYWQQRRFDRLTADGHEPFTIGYVTSRTGGFSYVQNEILADSDAIGELTPAEQALVSPVDGDQVWLDGTGLIQYRFAGDPAELLPFVARWRQGRLAKVPTSRVDLHYVLTGEKSTVPRGGPAGPPLLADPHPPLTSWGDGVPVVAVLDTGLDPASAAAQPLVDGQPAGPPRVVFDPQLDADILGEHPPVQGQVTELLSEAGHGTFIASVIARFADGVRIAAIKVLDPDGVGSEELLVTGLRRLRLDFVTTYDRTVKVVNLSLGGFTDDGGWLDDDAERDKLYPPELRDRPPSALAAELELWTGEQLQDTVMVCAAGNDGVADRPFWPAALAASPRADHAVVVAVASVDASLQASVFTNRGAWVSASSLGEDVVGDHPAGRVALGDVASETFDGHFAARWSGTSFAAPLVAAQVATLAEHPPPVVNGQPQAVPLSGRASWDLVEAETALHPAAEGGLGGIWDPRSSGPNLDPAEWV